MSSMTGAASQLNDHNADHLFYDAAAFMAPELDAGATWWVEHS